jgi:hypothetical protein
VPLIRDLSKLNEIIPYIVDIQRKNGYGERDRETD